MPRILALLALCLVLVGCGPAPVADVPLDTLLVQAGDLPSGYSGAQIRDDAPQMFDRVPAAQRTAYQEFAANGRQVGGVAVFLYDDPAQVAAAYAAIAGDLGATAQDVEGIGEKGKQVALAQKVLTIDIKFADVAFVRCRAVVHARFSTDNLDQVNAYAKRLDARLKDAVC